MIHPSTLSLEDALFPVEERKVHVSNNRNGGSIFVPQFRAIVDVEREHVFAVVASSYRLVTNVEAVELGKKCFCNVLGKTTAVGLVPFHVKMPGTRSFCHIDFVHEGVEFEPWQNDRWVPFMRITNSYNRSRTLRVDLGFCRWICTNGMIFGKKSVSFRFVHSRDQVDAIPESQTSVGNLKSLEREFIAQLHDLKAWQISPDLMLPLLCRALGIQFALADMKNPKRRIQLTAFKNHIDDLVKKYVTDNGPNGYAALNLITDYATRPVLSNSPATIIDGLQKKSGQWVEDFLTAIKRQDFDFATYLGEYANAAEVLAA